MIDVSGLKLSLDTDLPDGQALALREIARQLGVKPGVIERAQLLKRSVDARKKANVHFTASYRLELSSECEERLLARVERKDAKLKGLQIKPAVPYVPLEIPQLGAPDLPPVVVGAGPAGLFAAWYLAKSGLKPLLVEQGAPVEERAHDVEIFFRTGELNPWSNIQFGEGGAGTFSDGKLTTNLKNRYTAHVLHWFVDAGAPESILWQAHPHVGSDNLARIVSAIREDIIRLGGEVRFHTKLVEMKLEDGQLTSITLRNTQTGEETLQPCTALVLACGHSARDTFELVRDAGFAMEQKPFSMGVRIEHPQALINEAQWGSTATHPALGAAEYKLAIHLPSGRSVYSFCMCPGGEVVAAASEAGGIVTNGMSNYARDGKNANAALLVNVDPADLASSDVLAGVELQRAVEQRAYRVAQEQGGAPYQAPAQTVGAFLGKEHAFGGDTVHCDPTYERGVVEAPLDEVLPDFITKALREALPLMGKKIRGFDNPGALLTAPETRSSSPVRICRDESLQAYRACSAAKSASSASGIYPCGEGPGFAGGIMSAAIDGIKVAEEVARSYEEAPAAVRGASTVAQAVSPASLPVSTAEAVAALRAGKPVIFPTDTVFGLGVAVNRASSPAELYQLKQRTDDKPIAWLVGGIDDLARYGKNVSAQALELACAHWPGALTLIVEASDEVPPAYRSAAGTIALRVPNDPTARALIEQVGPLATTSANISGEPAPTRTEELSPALTACVATVAGEALGGHASAVVDCTQTPARIVRQGAIALDLAANDLPANDSETVTRK